MTDPRHSYPFGQLLGATLAAALALLAWDFSGLDVALAHASGDASGFALRDNWLLANAMHEGGRRLAWALAVGLSVAVWWPVGILRQLPAQRRWQLAATCLLAVAAVSLLKASTGVSCPWDLAEFGGLAHHGNHWSQWLQADGGSGRCFPAGHASSGFAFVGGYFAYREVNPVVARRWLGASLLAGLVLGVGQQMRGAHFMSHTLWSGWVCWVVALLVDMACRTRLSSDTLAEISP